ncbi:nodulation protein NodZ [Spirulina subsalsa FACHB-351]|uniref:Nodulation protein NodZ n=1 Tax=Spirulina subsalsa FACHB-351 TaxID=234711 RepID=A0ABT3L4B2_9CYAN|nr:nodulation protein NodZ [Spirulina subsalsa]MCW6036315.1 nodulation protein NodZ [Spirulina subsalsa FACHB-351]
MKKTTINFQKGWAGVFAKLNMYIVACKVAKRSGYLPVPYWPSVWHEEEKFDIWDVFFERVGHSVDDKYGLTQEVNIVKLFAKHERDKQVNPAPQYAGILRVPFDRHECHAIIDEYILLQPWLKEKIQSLYEQHFSSFRVLGVHLRGPGKNNVGHGGVDRLDYLLGVGSPPFSKYFELIDKSLDEYDRIFLGTDAGIVQKKVRERYGDRVLTVASEQYELGEAHAKNRKASGGISFNKLGMEALVDAYLLARCDQFIHGNSHLSNYVMCLSPDLKTENVYEGLYERAASPQLRLKSLWSKQIKPAIQHGPVGKLRVHLGRLKRQLQKKQ